MSKKSGYLNRTLEFHKIYEEEIIPILKSYKQQNEKVDKKKVVCPYCGHPVNAMQTEDAHCRGIYFRCKNKDCKKIFELKL